VRKVFQVYQLDALICTSKQGNSDIDVGPPQLNPFNALVFLMNGNEYFVFGVVDIE
jgi:hypothetical protein